MNSRPSLPQETLDFIVDLLRGSRDALKQCCLVCKSWIPRTRRYLFYRIAFRSLADLEAWRRTFPDPANSPAYHTRSLTVECLPYITAADAEDGGWIRAFSKVELFNVMSTTRSSHAYSLVPFRNISPALKSLCVEYRNIPLSEVFGLMHNLPLLEDLMILCHGMDTRSSEEDERSTFKPSTSPPLTGTLLLYMLNGVEHTARRLLNLPHGLHFRKFVCTWCTGEELRWIMALVEECSATLERIEIECYVSPGTSLQLLRWTIHLTRGCCIS
ncbi:hypothetical protein BJ322DRAFT_501077 [Thelephora terrestris]|uniref:F-box domain-containing protein n=1 Tax=Thelephora terrestris TaxID=56493 RepID=A0A9P6H2P4_9AGAM|nr:hypothetical protein BJ322DRAFT_501077 [Thelephora terrestris]